MGITYCVCATAGVLSALLLGTALTIQQKIADRISSLYAITLENTMHYVAEQPLLDVA